MPSINSKLKIKLLLLSLLFPLAFSIEGFLVGQNLNNLSLAIAFSIVGFALGVLLDFFCYSQKLFTLALFYTPIPLSIFMLAWSIADIFTSSKYSLFIGLIGFAIGLWLNYEMVLPYPFFKIKKRILAIVYFIFSVSCLGFFMGIPFFNILLGVLAGNYLSIRVMEHYQRTAFVKKSLQQGALFTAAVLFVMITISGFSILTDLPSSIHIASQLLNVTVSPVQFYWLLAGCGIVLIVLQYFITLFTGRTMYEYWMNKKNDIQKTKHKNQLL